jgi:CheY-like chemotaxis protein
MAVVGPSRTVLLVDDDPAHLKLYSWVINRGGFRPVTALVGSTSVAFPKNRQIDLVVMDYRLASELSAHEVARHIRAEFPSVPIILLSELMWMPDEMVGLVDGFVTKGEPDELIEKIAEFAQSPDKKKEQG